MIRPMGDEGQETDDPDNRDRRGVPARIDPDRALSILTTHFMVRRPGERLVWLDFFQVDVGAASARDNMAARLVMDRGLAQALINDLSALLADDPDD